MKYGEIWLVNHPRGVGHEYHKERPAVIIQSNEFIQSSALLTTMPFTSKLDKRTVADLFVAKDNQNKLHANSIIKVKHIQSFDKSRFLKRIGELDKFNLQKIKNYLKQHFAIN